MYRVLIACAVALFGLTGCARDATPPQEAVGTPAGPFDEAVANQWITERMDDGGLLIKHRDPRNHQPTTDPEQLQFAVQQAAESVIATDDPEAFPDVVVDIDDPGIVKIRGHVTTEREAVNVINAALDVRGVAGVISYLDYPGPEVES